MWASVEVADQRKDAGEMGTGEGQAESSGGSAGSAGAAVSRHAGAAGEGCGRADVIRMRRAGKPVLSGVSWSIPMLFEGRLEHAFDSSTTAVESELRQQFVDDFLVTP